MAQPPGRGYGYRGGGGHRGGRGGFRGGFRGGRRGPPEKARKTTAEMMAYPEEHGGAYRPMGASLTIQEVCLAR